MWSNSKKKQKTRSANVKAYLGMTSSYDFEDESHSSSLDTSSCQSALPIVSPKKSSILVEIPEELDCAGWRGFHDKKNSKTIRYSSERPSSFRTATPYHRDDTAAIEDFGANLADLDNYMLSVFHMSDETTSVYTKATAENSFSSSSTTTSISSSRTRHRGAFRNRRKDLRRGAYERDSGCLELSTNKTHSRIHGNGSSWVESMKRSAATVFADGEKGWTPKNGWQSASKTNAWDASPGDDWNDADPLFDSMKSERLEI